MRKPYLPHLRGARAEDRALQLLCRHGLTLVARNVRCRAGEIDLVMRDAGLWVFVEVRYRAAGALVAAADSIGPHKRRRIERTAEWFLLCRCGTSELNLRFDVVAIDGDHVRWITNVFES